MIETSTIPVIPRMMVLREAAARTGLSYDFLRKICLRGRLVHVRCGSKILINFDKLLEYLNSNTEENQKTTCFEDTNM